MAKADLLSMTGFGSAEADVPQGRLRVEIRTVNHRFMNLQVRMPTGFDRYQKGIEDRLRKHFVRGHISLTLSLDRSHGRDITPSVLVDMERARAYQEAFLGLQTELGLGGRVGVELLAGFRDIFQTPERDRSSTLEMDPEDLGQVVDQAAAEVLEMRRSEGARMASDLSRGLDRMEEELEAVALRAPERLVQERHRLREAIRELLDGAAKVDEERIAREVAHLAERWDIHEEVVRFRSHLAMFRETLEVGSSEGVGKRFGFIAQELLRETNTIGSKANDAEIAARVVTLKEEIERFREQLENVE